MYVGYQGDGTSTAQLFLENVDQTGRPVIIFLDHITQIIY